MEEAKEDAKKAINNVDEKYYYLNKKKYCDRKGLSKNFSEALYMLNPPSKDEEKDNKKWRALMVKISKGQKIDLVKYKRL